jgi:hypothetical protein
MEKFLYKDFVPENRGRQFLLTLGYYKPCLQHSCISPTKRRYFSEGEADNIS